MKKASKEKAPSLPSEDALERYDWSNATRGRHAGKLATGTPFRRLEDDLAELFPTSASVNAALRALVALGAAMPKEKKGSAKAA